MNTSHAGDGRSSASMVAIPAIDDERFELGEVIGAGGMGTVHRALQRSVGRAVAVKVLAPEHAANAAGMSRFVREANVIARLNHPNIVQLIDFGRDRQGRMLLVMELLEGESLRSLLRREGRLSPDRAAWVAVQVLNALRAAHAAGIVHRDLKPENVFIHRAGEDDHVKVLDFGVAKLVSAERGEHDTSDGSLVGTLRYMAPEQVAGEPPDQRVDVYAAGVLLYEMLSASMPFDTRDRLVLLRQIIAEEPAHLATRAPWLPPAMADAVMGALAKDPRRRFQTADDFRRALQPFLAPDHARLSALSESISRPGSAPPSSPGGDFRSGVIRTGAQAVGHPSSPEVIAPSVAPAPPPSRAPWIALVVVLALAVPLGLFVAFARSQHTTSTSAPARPVPPSLAAPPQTAPAAPTQPAPAMRLVVVNTSPQGARVTDPDGNELCPSTPCAIPVAAGGSRPVRVTHGATSLPATLDGRAELASIDLRPLMRDAGSPVAAPAQEEPRRSGHRRPSRPAGNARHDEELPMFLPGGR
ncbi:MAG: serine/threonine-protein kinase [Polyangiales bacterium]